MIDVQMLHMPTEDTLLMNKCLVALKDEPVNILHGNGITDNLLQARFNGYKASTSEFVSSVDPDDEIVPGVFQQCIDYLKNNPTCNALYTNSYYNSQPMYKHTEWTLKFHLENRVPVHQIYIIRRTVMLEAYQAVLDNPAFQYSTSFNDQRVFDVIAKHHGFHFLSKVFGYYFNAKPSTRTFEEKNKARVIEINFRKSIFND